MTEPTFIKIKQAQALAICNDFDLSAPALALLPEFPGTADFLQQLIAQQHYPDAVRLLAHALPKREATWWACLSARHGITETTPANQIKAIELAEAWVYKPTDDNRRPTLAAAEATAYNNAASWAAIAAFWSGTDISPTPLAVIPPSEKLYAKAVTGAIMLAATLGEAEHIKDKYQLFLKQGLHIANGGDGRAIQ